MPNFYQEMTSYEYEWLQMTIKDFSQPATTSNDQFWHGDYQNLTGLTRIGSFEKRFGNVTKSVWTKLSY